MTRWLAGAIVAGALVATPAAAWAEGGDPGTSPDEETVPQPILALAGGTLTGVVALGVGSTVIATGERPLTRNAGLLGMAGGLSLAPLVAHAIVGEWKRGLFFAGIPLLGTAALATVVAASPEIVSRGPAALQFTFLTLVSATLFGSAIGVLDATRVEERRRPASRSGGVSVAPMFGGGVSGISVGGVL